MLKFDADRYSRLAMPNPLPPDKQACGHLPGESDYNPNLSKLTENGLAWDILTQVGELLKSDVPDNPIGRAADRVYLTGESQSAGYLSNYFAGSRRTQRCPTERPSTMRTWPKPVERGRAALPA